MVLLIASVLVVASKATGLDAVGSMLANLFPELTAVV